jgi:hypothetical protein
MYGHLLCRSTDYFLDYHQMIAFALLLRLLQLSHSYALRLRMSSKKSKGDISPENLQSHGIFYDTEPSYILPEHIDAVREILLSFKGTLSDNWTGTLQKEAKQYGSEGLSPEALQPPESALVPT